MTLPDPGARPALQATYDQLMALITGRSADDQPPRPPSDPETLVEGDARATAGARVHVHAHMYRARMVEALASQFPRLARWVGADAFAALTLAHVTEHPSRHPSLRFIGRHFPDWLAARAAHDEAARPVGSADIDDVDNDADNDRDGRDATLAALAHLEWARTDVFDAADQATLAIDAVRAWPVEQFATLPLRLIGAHRLLTVAPAVAALWDAIGAGDPAADTNAHDDGDSDGDAPDTTWAAPATGDSESLLIWRQGFNVFHRVIDDAERDALRTVAGGTTFGAICDALLHQRSAEEATLLAFGWLSNWTGDELLVAP